MVVMEEGVGLGWLVLWAGLLYFLLCCSDEMPYIALY